MSDNAGGKEYAISAVLVFAALAALFFLKTFFFRGPEGFAVIAFSLPILVPCLAIGLVVSLACIIVRKPGILAFVAVAVIFVSFFYYADIFSAVFAGGAVCALGSIPFIAELLAKKGQKV